MRQTHTLARVGCPGKIAGMSQTARLAPGRMVFHVLNRSVARMEIFQHERDYDAIQRVVRYVEPEFLNTT